MTARPDLPSGGSSAPATNPQPVPTQLRAAMAVSVVGAVLIGLGPLIGLVAPSASAAFLSWPLLLVLALLPAGLAAAFIRRGRLITAAAVLVGPAALAPGRLALDAQVVADPALAARPELLKLASLDVFSPSIGAWLLLVGHAAAIVAGFLAVRSVGPGGEDSDGHRQRLLTLVFCVSVPAVVGVMMAPFSSEDPYLLPRHALDAPAVVLIGSVLIAVGVPAAAGYLAGSVDQDFTRGGLLGLAAALTGVVVPPLIAAVVLAEVSFSWGPLLGLIAAFALVALAMPAGRARSGEVGEDLRLPALNRLINTSAVLALVAGALTVLAALAPQVEMPFGLRDPSPYPARMLWPAGVVLLLVGAGLLVPRLALRVRPLLPVVWVLIPLAATSVLDAVFTAVQAAGADAEIGAWSAGVAVLFAAAAAIVAAVAGAVERDEVDLTEIAMRRPVLIPALVSLVLGAAAFSLPVVTAPDYAAPGVFAEFGTTSWGLLIALAAVVAAAVLAPMCRPPRAAALLCGAAVVVAVRVLEYPLTAERLPGSEPGTGLWFGIAGVLALLVSAAAAIRTKAS
ncbi:hypothetical protein [Saccharopolyspora antimicrobica]|nr:hypothetical protein [Saccharopolyspora antimicrobica]